MFTFIKIVTKTNNHRRSNNNSNKSVNTRFYECKQIINELSQVASKEYYQVSHDRIKQLLIIKQIWEEDINFSLKLITTESVVDEVLNKEVTFFNQHANEFLETSSHIQGEAISTTTTSANQLLIIRPTIDLSQKQLDKKVPKRVVTTRVERKKKT